MMKEQKVATAPMPLPSSKQRIMASKKEKQDISIMETNNSCIVSKRSVEKIYHKDDHGFLRYFVKKFQRRSPLINRGYWLRMRAIEQVVRTFLQDTQGRKRNIVNLGCGYDPLPFKFLSRDPQLCEDAVFIDVDYKQLMGKKSEMIRTTSELRTVIGLDAGSSLQNDGVIIDCRHYKAVACDLEDMPALDKILTERLQLKGDPVLFLAEVSITYMDALAAEKLVVWASTFSDARFAVLEQYLPDGEDHPFAVTMLKHFQKLNSPLKTAIRHPSATDQQRRFTRGQWTDVDFRSLWNLWSNDDFIPPSERNALDEVEPFDEWEEFALFCSHYFLLVARNTTRGLGEAVNGGRETDVSSDIKPIKYCSHYHPTDSSLRRFGASHVTHNAIWTAGGYGAQSRLGSVELLLPIGDINLNYEASPATIPALPTALMCHSMTHAGNGKQLLVGGRASPSAPSAACWLQHANNWSALPSLPHGLFRHSAVRIDFSSPRVEDEESLFGVLVFGGKTGPSEISDKWLIWTEKNGWQTPQVVGTRPAARFGAAMLTVSGQSGYLCGGIGKNGTVLQDIWSWVLLQDEHQITIQFQDRTEHVDIDLHHKSSFGRFGATLVRDSTKDLLLVGGITGGEMLTRDREVLSLKSLNDEIVVKAAHVDWQKRPMLVGSTIEFVNGSLVVAHGGAVCFSFGTYWNEGCWTVTTPEHASLVVPWRAMAQAPQTPTFNIDHIAQSMLPKPSSLVDNSAHSKAVETAGALVDMSTLAATGGFERILDNGKPVILSGLKIGTCTDKWTTAYLKEQVGAARSVVVHQAKSPVMNFLAKDFTYTTLPFGTFLDEISSGACMYLRARAADQPAAKPTTLQEDFPTLASDFVLPPELQHVIANMHSSPLRIGGNMNMWLHFDVMANVYCQVQGQKQLILFPPSDVKYLEFPAGASSSRLNIFDAQGQAYYPASTHPVVFDVKPGDVLFIPPLWLHTAKPTKGVSVAVNVFFRNMQSGYAAGKDVYGNRDLQAYEYGRRDVAKIVKAFHGLPDEVRHFYLGRLARELEEA